MYIYIYLDTCKRTPEVVFKKSKVKKWWGQPPNSYPTFRIRNLAPNDNWVMYHDLGEDIVHPRGYDGYRNDTPP